MLLITHNKKRKITLRKNQGIMIHGGGWKKMNEFKISNSKFKIEVKSYLP